MLREPGFLTAAPLAKGVQLPFLTVGKLPGTVRSLERERTVVMPPGAAPGNLRCSVFALTVPPGGYDSCMQMTVAPWTDPGLQSTPAWAGRRSVWLAGPGSVPGSIVYWNGPFSGWRWDGRHAPGAAPLNLRWSVFALTVPHGGYDTCVQIPVAPWTDWGLQSTPAWAWRRSVWLSGPAASPSLSNTWVGSF